MYLKNVMPKKSKSFFIYSRTNKSKVAEPDISAGSFISGSVLKYGVCDLNNVKG